MNYRSAAGPAVVIALLAIAACDRQDPQSPAAPEAAAPALTQAAPAPPAYGRIDRARLLAADSEPQNWFTAGRDFGKSHFSPLDQINRDTAGRLGFAWEYKTNTNRGLEATPIVVDGVMYTAGTTGRVYALNAKTGEQIWAYDPQIDRQVNRFGCCDEVNRGVAVWQGKVYVGSLDGRLIALNAADGAVLWEVDTFIYKDRAYTSSGAPEVAGNVVVIGNAGAEYDARGYISAYDLDTGELKWRFFTVPGDPKNGYEHPEVEMAAQTWDPDSRWDVGAGGTAWDAMVYDPELNLLYVGTGNAALYNYKERSPAGGDNLFLASILAINPDTGRLVWYYQQVPGERWDYTSTMPIILSDLEVNGQMRKVLMQAPKDGFYYIHDRATGELLSANKYAAVNWASHVDLTTGKPAIDLEAADYTTGPKFVFPSNMGAHSWHPMAYSPLAGLVYIPVIEAGVIYFDLSEGHEYRPTRNNTGVTALMGGIVPPPGRFPDHIQNILESGELLKRAPADPDWHTVLRAFDPRTGATVWEGERGEWWDRSGVLATAGGLVFQGTGTGRFQVRDDATGALLQDIDVKSAIMAAPMTYAVDGEQYVAVMAAYGGGGWGAAHANSASVKYGNDGRILVFKLDGGPMPAREPLPPAPPIPEPPALTADDATVARGQGLFAGACAACHFNQWGAPIKDLRRMTPETHAAFNAIVLQGAFRSLGMPQWDDVLTEDDTNAIHAYLISQSWNAYRAEQRNGQ